ncbi:MAG: hypothetical protein GAK30_03497 [Paracidovorax wautersii]|uniref:Uncharacterized protein n=1 Tax=Paracidovorax wautersii TaxID=1177982 RepID=A0A7V8FL52_9BURK|nr:MAG: hypothetical protein GAK30_03497 [Paracidovorax wautersii]
MTGHAVQPAPGDLRAAIGAATVLVIGMGFGRFAFTAIYPHMVEEGILTLRAGSIAASANYAGYLLGALLAMGARTHHAHRLCLLSTAGTVVCMAVLAVLTSVPLILAVRGIAGLFSALSIIAASQWLLAHRGHVHRAPLLYAGVGLGIAASAEVLVLATHMGLHSPGMWLTLAAIALLLGIAVVPSLSQAASPVSETTPTQGALAAETVAAGPLIALYGLAGFGYIVTATYLPLLVTSALPHLDSAHVWAVFGLGAAPSCLLWHRIHHRLGTRKALRWNLLVQAIGVALPVLFPMAVGYIASALLVGGTFMGTVTIAMPAAQQAARKVAGPLLATMTLVYGVGQIVGPSLADRLYAHSPSFSPALLVAAVSLVVAAILSGRL